MKSASEQRWNDGEIGRRAKGDPWRSSDCLDLLPLERADVR
jgi:hypothetical protein